MLAGSGTSGAGVAGDINGDGKIDIVLTGGTPSTLFGNGNGTFAAGITLSTTLQTQNALSKLVDFNNDGALDLLTSHNASQYTNVSISNTTRTSSIGRVNLLSQANARSTLTSIDAIANRISAELGRIGSLQSRLSTAVSTLSTTTLNYAQASSRITDTDIAAESANLVRTQILQQAASSVLAQANTQPEIALRLLRG